MTSFKNHALRRKMIMDHYLHPLFKGLQKQGLVASMQSQFCVDFLTLELLVKDQKIVHLRWEGDGCAVFQATNDLMVESLQNIDLLTAKQIIENFMAMIYRQQTYNLKLLAKLGVMEEVSNNFNRVHCAEIIALLLKKMLNQYWQKF